MEPPPPLIGDINDKGTLENEVDEVSPADSIQLIMPQVPKKPALARLASDMYDMKVEKWKLKDIKRQN